MMVFLRNRVKSFRYALAGLKDILATEHNAWVHAVLTVAALSLTLWLGVGGSDLALIIIVISLVWIAESFNTVLELVIDIVSPEYNQAAKRAKDIAAAGVLFASLSALAVGVVLLGPPLLAKFGF